MTQDSTSIEPVELHEEPSATAETAAVPHTPAHKAAPRAPQRPPDAPIEPSTLLVRVESAFALEFQHLTPIIIDRVNARLGWRCVGRIGPRQGPIGQARPRRALLAIDPRSMEQAQAAAAPIEDEALRAALTRLGAAALSDKTRG